MSLRASLGFVFTLFACAAPTPPPSPPPLAPPPGPAAPPPLLDAGTSAATTASPALAAGPGNAPLVAIRVENPLDAARQNETVVVALSEARRLVPAIVPNKTIVVDAAGSAVLSQAVDMDGDHAADELVFQTSFAPREVKQFTLRFQKRVAPPLDAFRVYGRFVRERHDDFAWENELLARRAYGPDLETWEREPLTSSGLDAWTKRVPKLVVNEWYLRDAYHEDHGEGADFYSVGKTRGCGGVGLWAGGKLHVSRNFTTSRVLANGPLRLVFELDYAPWDAAGTRVSETKRVILDAGQGFERYESTFKTAGGGRLPAVGIGIAKHAGGSAALDGRALVDWEPLKDGNLGCAVAVPEGKRAERQETETDFLLITDAPASGATVYYAGFAWDRAGRVADAAAWKEEVRRFSQRIAAPLRVSVALPDGAKPWSARIADSVLERHPNVLDNRWTYDNGLVLMALERVYKKTGDRRYHDYVKRTVDALVQPDGSILTYKPAEFNIDHINMGKVLFMLLAETADPADRERYTKALALVRSQMKTHPRTKEGGFWHKQIYPYQMWLDGLYMASPFLTEYGVTFDEPALLDEVAKQITMIERHTRDAKSGLLYHGYDESRAQRWADPKTGRSPHFWGRAMGWYAMALVDVLDRMPKTHPRREAVLGVLRRLAAAVAGVQDREKGVFWQVLDAPKKPKNYKEASATAMFVYALSKAVKNGWLDAKTYGPVASRAYLGMFEEFVDLDDKGLVNLNSVCKVAGLGGTPYRDGSYAYYTSTEVVANDPKGVGPFLLANLERE